MALSNILLNTNDQGKYTNTERWKRLGVNYVNCGTMTCDNMQTGLMDCSTMFINGQPFTGGVTGPTGPAGSGGPICSKRYNVDMSSNPEPLGPGLIVTAASTQSPNTFYIPLILSTGLGIASAYDIDPDNYLTFNGTDSFTVNIEGSYNIGTNIPCLNYAGNSPQSIFTQILINGQSIFGGPPGYTDACTPIMSFSGTPVDPAFDSGCILDASTNMYLNVGDIISFSVWVGGVDEIVLSFIGSVWVNLISSGGAIGPTGPAGPTGSTGPQGISGTPQTEGFNVHLDSDQTPGANTNIENWAFDYSSQYYTSPNLDLALGIYTAPISGSYSIDFFQTDASAVIVVNGSPVSQAIDYATNQVIYLTSGDEVTVQSSSGGTISKLNGGSIGTWWSMSLQSSGPQGPTGPAGPTPQFEGICVHLDADLTYTADTNVTNYSVDYSAQFYTNSNFNLLTGEYTVPEDGYYNIQLSQGNDVFNFYVVYDGTPLQGPNGGDGSGMLQFTPYLLNGNVLTIRASTSGTIPKLNGSSSSINYCLSITKISGTTAGPAGPTGPAGTAPAYQGIMVHLDADLSYPDPDVDVVGWAIDYSAQFYNDGNFDLGNGVYNVPSSGKYLVSFNSSTYTRLYIAVNGSAVCSMGTGDESKTVTAVINVLEEDQITVRSYNSGGNMDKLNSQGSIGTWLSISKQVTASSSGISMICLSSGNTSITTGDYIGQNLVNASPFYAQVIVARAGYVSNMYCELEFAPGPATGWTFFLNKNGSGILSASINNSSTTGNSGNTAVLVSPGDVLVVQVTESGSPATGACNISYLIS